MKLTDEQWLLVQPLLLPASPPTPVPPEGLASPPVSPRCRPAPAQRLILDGILWKLAARSPWRQIPPRFGPWQTCYFHYCLWKKAGVLRKIITVLLKDVRERGKFDPEQAVKNGFVKFEKMGRRVVVYLPANVAGSWQVSTALLFFSRVAHNLEKRQGIARLTDPLAEIFYS
jgi:transposase